MSAKDMFEKLGYEEKTKANSVYYQQRYSLFNLDDTDCYKFIEFSKNNDIYQYDHIPIVRVYIRYELYGNVNTDGVITLDELKAINTKCKELGWLEDVKD